MMNRSIVSLFLSLCVLFGMTSAISSTTTSNSKEDYADFHHAQQQPPRHKQTRRRRINSKDNVVRKVNELARSTLLRKVGPRDDTADE
jgi:hypothetical protein